MQINFTPISMFGSFSLAVAGDSILLDGQTHALADLRLAVDGEQSLPKFVVTASEGSVTLLLPYWGSAPPLPATIVSPPDGPVEIPYDY